MVQFSCNYYYIMIIITISVLKNDTLSLSTFRRQLKHFYFSLY